MSYDYDAARSLTWEENIADAEAKLIASLLEMGWTEEVDPPFGLKILSVWESGGVAKVAIKRLGGFVFSGIPNDEESGHLAEYAKVHKLTWKSKGWSNNRCQILAGGRFSTFKY